MAPLWRLGVILIVLTVCGLFNSPPTMAAAPTSSQYYVPFDDTHLHQLFDGKVGCYNLVDGIGGDLQSFVFVTVGTQPTSYYYDHWEDGYDENPFSPAVGSSTEIGVLTNGSTKVFRSEIDLSRIGNVLYYDGRDRITVVGGSATVVRQVYPEQLLENNTTVSGIIAGAAWEMNSVSSWGTEFYTTVGEDLDFNGSGTGTGDDHDYAGLEVMAAQDNTTVFLREQFWHHQRNPQSGRSLLCAGRQ